MILSGRLKSFQHVFCEVSRAARGLICQIVSSFSDWGRAGHSLEVCATLGPPDGSSREFIQRRLVWWEHASNEIIDMIRHREPGEKFWWLDEEALKDNQPTDVL